MTSPAAWFPKGYHILSTGGTAKLLAKEGVEVEEVADYTGFPEMLDGRVKTLNPKIHAGILARRPIPEHMAALKEHGIDPIDIVCVNLYPFEQTIARPDCTLDLAIEKYRYWRPDDDSRGGEELRICRRSG